jgi:YidC/Oxa1 family membrane protein insertase
VGWWDVIFINPMINLLILLERLCFGNFGLAIIAFTVLVRVVTLPLMLRQLRSSRKMQEIAPQMKELQKKYKDPKRRQEEMMKLYREAGVNPLGCLGPMLIQFPIWIALYQALTHTVGGTPERIVDLSQRLYPWGFLQSAVPLPSHFLWLDLGRADPYFIMFGLVAATTWLQTKLSMNQPGVEINPQQQQTNTMLLWMMPLMFAWFTLTVPSGLALYWTVTNVIGIVMNWFVYGWHKRSWREVFVSPTPAAGRRPRPRAAPSTALTRDGADARSLSRRAAAAGDPAPEHKRPAAGGAAGKRTTTDGQPGDKRKDGGGGNRQGPPAARRRQVPGRRRGH